MAVVLATLVLGVAAVFGAMLGGLAVPVVGVVSVALGRAAFAGERELVLVRG